MKHAALLAALAALGMAAPADAQEGAPLRQDLGHHAQKPGGDRLLELGSAEIP